jgi:hypothetical protein
MSVKLNIVFHAGKDVYHFAIAEQRYSEREHLNAIADEMFKTGKYPNYSAAMAAATGVYDYCKGLSEGNLINRQARLALDKHAQEERNAQAQNPLSILL